MIINDSVIDKYINLKNSINLNESNMFKSLISTPEGVFLLSIGVISIIGSSVSLISTAIKYCKSVRKLKEKIKRCEEKNNVACVEKLKDELKSYRIKALKEGLSTAVLTSIETAVLGSYYMVMVMSTPTNRYV